MNRPNNGIPKGLIMLSQEKIGSLVQQRCSLKKALPWKWSQQWRNVLFIHWKVPQNEVLFHLPSELELDTWDSAAWITAVAFRLDIGLRGLPKFMSFSDLLELNLRTYVRRNGKPAIYFLSIHANSKIAVALARRFTPLPYAFAPITYRDSPKEALFDCPNPATTGERPILRVEFTPKGSCEEVAAHSVGAWLLERYRAYVLDKGGRLYSLSVEHPRWQVKEIVLESMVSGLGERWGLDLDRKPDCWHFSSGTDAVLWPFEAIGSRNPCADSMIVAAK
ncbi:MAG: YqjF family protein [Gemmataceae bacterium]